MELISILTELLLKVLFINLGKVMRLERVLWADTLVQSKKTYGLFRDEGMSAVGADKTDRSGDKVPGNEGLSADFILVLAVAAVVIVEIVMRGTAERVDDIIWYGLPIASLDRLNCFTIFPEIVFKKELPVLLNEGLDNRETVSGKFLVIRGMGVIEGPLLERNESTDQIQEPANRFILFLNYSK